MSEPTLSESEKEQDGTHYQPFVPTTPLHAQPMRVGQETIVKHERKPHVPDPSSSNIPPTQVTPPGFLEVLFPSASKFNEQQAPEIFDNIELGHYTIQKRIGSGGMGSVFAAQDNDLSRIVALKVLAPELSRDPSSVKRFRNEAKAAAQLDHDNIAGVYYSGEDRGLHYIAFEYVEGVNIRELIEHHQLIPLHQAVQITLQIAKVLIHTKIKGVVHRDIKPSNIIIEPNGRTKLVDWGLARALDPMDRSKDLTVDGTTLGTFDYISPEQARDPRKVDVRSDIYSLGCTFYHMVTGEAPYSHGTMLQKLLDHNSSDTPDPRKINPQIDTQLSNIIRKMMASSLDERYQKPEDLIVDLVMYSQQNGVAPLSVDSVVLQRQREIENPNSWRGNAFFLATTIVVILVTLLANQFVDEPTPAISLKDVLPVIPAKQLKLDKEAAAKLALTSGDATTDGILSSSVPGKQPQTTQAPLADGNYPPMLTSQLSVGSDDATQTANLNMKPVATTPTTPNVPPSIPETPVTETVASVTGIKPNSMPGPTPIAADANVKPYTLIVEGSPNLSFSSLEEAINLAPDNSEIEINALSTMEAPLRENPLTITPKSITLRGKSGTQPIICFRRPVNWNSGYIRLTQGSRLKVQNVHFLIQSDDGPSIDDLALFHLTQPRLLSLSNVSVTISTHNAKRCEVIMISNTADVYKDLAGMDEYGSEPPSIEISESYVRGWGDLVCSESIRSINLSIRQTVLGLDGSVLKHLGNEGMVRDEEVYNISLDQVTALNRQGLLVVDVGQTPRNIPHLSFRIHESILGNAGSESTPLIKLMGAAYESDLLYRMNWIAEHVYYQDYTALINVGSLISTTDEQSNPIWLREQWKTHWGSNETHSHWNEIQWSNPNRSFSPRLWKLDDFTHAALPPDEMGLHMHPGADLSRLPRLTSYTTPIK
jgi:serine/threonine-protein kinase